MNRIDRVALSLLWTRLGMRGGWKQVRRLLGSGKLGGGGTQGQLHFRGGCCGLASALTPELQTSGSEGRNIPREK